MRPIVRVERNDTDLRFREKVNNNFDVLAQRNQVGADTKIVTVIHKTEQYAYDQAQAAADAAILAAAADASAKVGLKNAVYWRATPPLPPAGGHKVDDIWFDTSLDSEGIVKNAVNRWDGTEWVPQPLGDAAIGNLSAGKITAGVIDVTITLNSPIINAGTINGGTITGGVVRTAASGPRVELASTNDPIYGYSWIDFYSPTGNPGDAPARVAAAGGSLYLSSPEWTGVSGSLISLGTTGVQVDGDSMSIQGGSLNGGATFATDANGHLMLKLLTFKNNGGEQEPDDTGVILKSLNSGGVMQVRTGADGGYGDVHANTLVALSKLRTDSYLQVKEQGGTNTLRDLYLWTDGTTWQLRFYVGAALKKLTFV